MDPEQETQRVEETPPVYHKPQHRKNKRRLVTAAVLVLNSGVMLFGAIKIIDATQKDVTPCLEWRQRDCVIKEKRQTPCPKSEWKPSCTLDAAAQSKQPLYKENSNE